MKLTEWFTRRSVWIVTLSLIWVTVLALDLVPWLRGGSGTWT